MKIHMMIEMPTPEQTEKAQPPMRMPIEDKVRRAIELVDSGHESAVEWRVLNKMYADLCSRKPTPRITNLINMIKPVLAKFGYHGVPAETK